MRELNALGREVLRRVKEKYKLPTDASTEQCVDACVDDELVDDTLGQGGDAGDDVAAGDDGVARRT